MKVFATRCCRHLLNNLGVEPGRVEIKNFSDGELYVRVEEPVKNRDVWVLAATPAPAENLLELYFLLDALQREGAFINLFLTYFGYARQDRAKQGEALSSEVVFRFLKTFPIQKTNIIHIHNPKLQQFFDFDDIILLDFFLPLAQDADCIVAPDQGAAQFAGEVARRAGKELVVMHKKRAGHEKIERTDLQGEVRGKKVLIVDDMIVTGNTMIYAAQALQEHGASEILAAATHGLFSGNAVASFAQSPIAKVYVTNTLEQAHDHPKVTVIDCAPMIEPFFK